MLRRYCLYLAALVSMLSFSQAFSQLPANPKLSPKDLDSAKSLTREAGGGEAELVYAARLDVIQKGSFDSLVVIYAKTDKRGKEFYGVVAQGGKNYPLVSEQPGLALKFGDQFLRIGLKHEEGKSPLLRLMASATIAGKGEMQRNVDFQFNGTEFTLIGQSLTAIPKQL